MPSIAVRAGPTPRQSAHRPTLRRCEPRASSGSAPSLTIQGSRYTHIDSIIATSAEDRLMAHAVWMLLLAVPEASEDTEYAECHPRRPSCRTREYSPGALVCSREPALAQIT